MPAFEILFEFTPPGAFGLPQEGQTILPLPIKDAYGPTLDTRTKNLVTHGTLSIYRDEEHRFKADVDAARCRIKAYDNFALVTTEAPTHQEAEERAGNLIEKLLLRWAVYADGVRFKARINQVTDTEGNVYPFRRTIKVLSVRGYNLDELTKSFGKALAAVILQDQPLERSLIYYDRFLLLQEMAQQIDTLGREFGYLTAEMLLNLYKSITTILGDPSKDRDYQSRFKKIGLPNDFWQNRVEPIKKARDALDVAHYTYTESPEQLRKKVGEANAACRETIKSYVEWLAGNPNRT
ncbi:hypothetical protein MYX77_02805 [Acidobacteriia bacterium AH_259_A11_L15]|nr:hypothetical protein [Acidobacteriia bacterium AH_259_A11_L15]